MAKKLVAYLLLLCIVFSLFIKSDSNPVDFIKTSCKSTRYSLLCVQSLSRYATTINESHKTLAQVALTVSLSRARLFAFFVAKTSKLKGMKPVEYQAVKDCVDEMSDSVYQLRKSIEEFGLMGGDFSWHMSNVQTWVSAALTDANTCLDGFSGGSVDAKLKEMIRRRVVHVGQVTSNALALINLFAARHI